MRWAHALSFLALAACGSTEEPAPAAPAPTPEEAAPEETAQAESPPDEPEPPPPRAAIRIPVGLERELDAAVHATLEAGGAPGAVVVLGRRDGVLFERAYGRRAVDPEPRPMTRDTIFDLASLTKAVATATSVWTLIEAGRLALDDPAAAHVPGLDRRITVRHLLQHTSGLPAVNPLREYEGTREEAIAAIAALPLEHPPGARVRYSDLGYVLLGEVVRGASGRPLDAYAAEAVFGPLGMTETRFRPPEAWRPRVAPTERAERRGGALIHGVVHDPRAWRLGGVAGNAGLFSTAADLSRFARAMLGADPVLRAETVAAMTAPVRLPGGARTLGWDVGRRGLSARAYGHGGYTGTSLWIDPERDVFVLLLSNRVHPDGEGDVQPLVRALGPLAARAAEEALPAPGPIEAGIDVLEAEGFARLEGATIALLTHDAARARDGRRTLDVLHASPVEVARVWAPEHGLDVDREGHVADGVDRRTGLTVHGLFGRTRAPTDAMLEGVDAVVIDLQDVGVRFYTYASTVRRVLEAAKARGLRVVILDRPDPLGGGPPRGPVSEEALASFVNHHPLPTVHGLTLGELATLLNVEREIDADLEVVELRGWSRAPWAETGLRWVPPSPNLRSPAQVQLYPALALLEPTNVSVGRGTDAPFERLGAPWIDARLAELEIPGVALEADSFVPRSSRHRGVRCRGVRVRVVEPARYEPVRTGLALARALHRLYPERFETARLERLIGHRGVTRGLLEGVTLDALEAGWTPDLQRFGETRARYLRYRRSNPR